MNWPVLVITALPVLPGAVIWKLMRKLRRAGRADRAGERFMGAWALIAAVNLAVTAVFPNRPPWVTWTYVGLTLLVSYGFLIYRIHQHPHALFAGRRQEATERYPLAGQPAGPHHRP